MTWEARATTIQWLNWVALFKWQQMGAIMGFTVSIGMTCGLECDSHALACPSGLKYCRLFGQLFPCRVAVVGFVGGWGFLGCSGGLSVLATAVASSRASQSAPSLAAVSCPMSVFDDRRVSCLVVPSASLIPYFLLLVGWLHRLLFHCCGRYPPF